MKNRIVPWLAGLCLGGAALASAPSSGMARELAQEEAQALTRTVAGFYTDYLAYAEHGPRDLTIPGFLSRRADVHPDFIRKIQRFLEALQQEEEPLPYDPILMAQDVPMGMRYGTPQATPDGGEVILWTVWGHQAASPLCVRLAGDSSGWRITDIIDMNQEQNRASCGGAL